MINVEWQLYSWISKRSTQCGTPIYFLKLIAQGVKESSVAWIKDYLSQRSISLCVGSTLSKPFLLSADIPQGSHLGPIFLFVFINGLSFKISVVSEIYPDDTLLPHEFTIDDFHWHEDKLQTAIRAASDWAIDW